MSTEIKDEFNWILNTDSQEVDYLPTGNPHIVKLGVVKEDEELGMQTVNKEGYESIVEVLLNELEFPEVPNDDFTQDYFTMRCNEASGYGTPSLSNKAYDKIFEELADSGFTISDMLKQMPRILITWHEDTPIDILFDADKYEYDNPNETRTRDELLKQAVDVIVEDDFKTFYDFYDNDDGQDIILYSAS